MSALDKFLQSFFFAQKMRFAEIAISESQILVAEVC